MSRYTNRFRLGDWRDCFQPQDYYSSLSPDKNNNDGPESLDNQHHVSPRRENVLRAIALVLSLALLAMTIQNISLRKNTPIVASMAARVTCGHSVEEARSLGCTFDELSKAWLPPECPRFGGTEYVDAGYAFGNGSSWKYYTDRHGTEEYSLEDVTKITRGGLYWTTRREHAHHCAWMLIRMAHVFKTDGRRDQLVQLTGHAHHCAKKLLDMALEGPEPQLDEIAVKGDVGFGHC